MVSSEISIPVFWEKVGKNIIDLSSAELAQRVVWVIMPLLKLGVFILDTFRKQQ